MAHASLQARGAARLQDRLVRCHSKHRACSAGPGARGRRGRNRNCPARWGRSRACASSRMRSRLPRASRRLALRRCWKAWRRRPPGAGRGTPGPAFASSSGCRVTTQSGASRTRRRRGRQSHRVHGDLGLVALGQQRGADAAQVLGPEVARLDAARPGAPGGEGRHRGLLPSAAVEALVARGVVAVGDRAGRLVEVRVAFETREGHGPVLLDRRLVGVQELAAAADEEHGGAAPGAELPVSRAVMPRCSQPLSQIASKSESTSGRGSCSSSASCGILSNSLCTCSRRLAGGRWRAGPAGLLQGWCCWTAS